MEQGEYLEQPALRNPRAGAGHVTAEPDQRYRAVMDHALISLLELNPDGLLRNINRHGCRTLELHPREDWLGKPFLDLVTEIDRAAVNDYLEQARAGEICHFEFTAAGSGRCFKANFFPLIDGQGQVRRVMSSCQDISQRKLTEHALRHSEEQFRHMAAHLREVIWFISPDRQRVFYVSPGFEVIWGIPVGEVFKDPHLWTRCIHPDDLARVEAARSDEPDGSFDISYRIIRPDKEIRWIRDRAYPIFNELGDAYQLTGIAEDITDRKNTEQALARSEARYRGFFNTISDGVLFVDAKNRIEDANVAFLDMIGYTFQELESLSPQQLTPTSWLAWEEASVLPRVKEHGHSAVYEKQMIRKSGATFPVSAQIWRLEDEGDHSGLLIQIRDLTDQKRIEDEKARLEAQLRQAQKMETIGTLAGGIAHDFNNILTPILGFTRMALEDEGEEQVADLNQVLKAANRARELVKQILTFSRHDSPGHEAVCFYTIVREAVRMLRSSLPATIKLHLQADHKEDQLIGNPTQLMQVIMNLATNAFQAMPDRRGSLAITLRRIHIDRERSDLPPSLSGGFWLNLEIDDDGQGIPVAIRDRIFEPFFTTKGVSEGTGLGLSVVHGIVQSHDGVITVKSEEAVGTTFQLYFPLAGHVLKEDPVTVTRPKGGNERILLVDDERTITVMCKKMLERLGYTVTPFNDSMKALKQFRETPEDFDLLLTDQIMPRLTGLELSARIKELRRDFPVVMFTGFSDKVDAETCQRAGIDQFMLKPILAADLDIAIRAALASAEK